jgi:hypothetical protein
MRFVNLSRPHDPVLFLMTSAFFRNLLVVKVRTVLCGNRGLLQLVSDLGFLIIISATAVGYNLE